MSGYISSIITSAPDSAFANMFEVLITPPDGKEVSSTFMAETNTYLRDKAIFRAEKVSFGEGFDINTEMINATKTNYLKDATRPSTVTITFRESQYYSILSCIKQWMNLIYCFEGRFFTEANPYGDIKISFGNTLTPISSTGQAIHTGSFELRQCFPKSLRYPSFDWRDTSNIKIEATFSFNEIVFGQPATA